MTEKPTRNAVIRTSSLPDGSAVLVNEKTNWAFTIAPLGALVWEHCDGNHSAEEIANIVQGLVEADSEQLKGEVQKILEQLTEDGFLD